MCIREKLIVNIVLDVCGTMPELDCDTFDMCIRT